MFQLQLLSGASLHKKNDFGSLIDHMFAGCRLFLDDSY